MSKHGGSPSSGLVVPAGLESLKSPDGSVIIVPEAVKAAAAESNTRRERARQFERRRIAVEVLPTLISWSNATEPEAIVSESLKYADALLAQTGNEVA